MRFQKYINEDEFNILGFYCLFDGVNETSDETFAKLQALGHKVGVRVNRTKTFQDLMGGAGKGLTNLMKLVFDYSLHADILDPAPRKKLEADIKAQFSKVRKEDVVAFMVNLDKTFLGITAIPRHILQNILGVEFTSYNNWASNHDYVRDNMRRIISVLKDMGDEESLVLAKRIYKNVTGKDI